MKQKALRAFSPLSALLMTFMVNARHIFYGLSMLEPFKKLGRFRPYMIFSLTDETYSLLCGIEPPEDVYIPRTRRHRGTTLQYNRSFNPELPPSSAPASAPQWGV